MGWQDRRYNPDYGEGGPWGGLRRAFRRIFVEGDDFFSWALPLFRVPRSVPGIGGIAVRIHLLYVVWMIVQMIFPIEPNKIGYLFTAFTIGTLFVLVLLHEFGHCLACRWVGGDADRVLMWPLGGLAFCQPPHAWKPNLITTLGGPAVNFVLIFILGGAILAAGAGWHVVIYNPFNPGAVYAEDWFVRDTSYWRYLLWSAYNANLALFLFNMLLVMFPMDAGRILQELLWRKMGYKRSMLIASNLGLALAIIIGTAAIVTGANLLFGVCVFGALTCFQQKRAMALLEDWSAEAQGGDLFAGGMSSWGKQKAGAEDEPLSPSEDRRKFAAAAKAQERARAQQAEVDRILEKIRQTGMASLTRGEKATLKEATERQRSQ